MHPFLRYNSSQPKSDWAVPKHPYRGVIMKTGKSTETSVYTGYAVTDVFSDPQSVLAFFWAFMLPERLRFTRKTDLDRKEVEKINTHSKVLYLCKVSLVRLFVVSSRPALSAPQMRPSLTLFCAPINPRPRVYVAASSPSAQPPRLFNKYHFHGAEGWEVRYQ